MGITPMEGGAMSNKASKKLRKEVTKAGGEIFDEIRRQINAKPVKTRIVFAWRILLGQW